MKIATWIVRTMYQAGKLENIKQEATRLKVDILGLADDRWLESGNLQCDSHTLIYNHIDYITINKRFRNSIHQLRLLLCMQ